MNKKIPEYRENNSNNIKKSIFSSTKEIVEAYFNFQEKILDSCKDLFKGDQGNILLNDIIKNNNNVMKHFINIQEYLINPLINDGKILSNANATLNKDLTTTFSDNHKTEMDKIKNLEKWLIDEITQVTGFPREMIQKETDFDAELGIDSITRMQIIMKMITEFPDIEKCSTELRMVNSISSLLRLVKEEKIFCFHNDSNKGVQFVKKDVLCQWLTHELSQITGFPEEMIKKDSEFESDLGIDSITRMQIIMKMITEFPEIEKCGAELRLVNSINSLLILIEDKKVFCPSAPLKAHPLDGESVDRVVKDDNYKESNSLYKELHTWDDILTWIKTSLVVLSKKDIIITESIDFYTDLGIDIFAYEKIINNLFEIIPELKVAGQELYNCTNINQLKNLICGIIPFHDKNYSDDSESVERYLIDLKDYNEIISQDSIRFPREIFLIGCSNNTFEYFSNEIKKIGINIIPIQYADKKWNSADKNIAIDFNDIAGLSDFFNQYIQDNRFPAVLFLANSSANTFLNWEDELDFAALGIFIIAKALISGRDERNVVGDLFAVLRDGHSNPFWSACSGVIKSISREWINVNVQHLIYNSSYNTIPFSYILTNLLNSNKENNFFYDEKKLQSFEARKFPITIKQGRKLNLGSDSVLFITGGGDGISAEIGCMMAEKYQCKIVAVGRTPYPINNRFIDISDDAILKKEIFKDVNNKHNDSNIKISISTEVQKLYKQIKRQQAIINSENRINNAGGTFYYFPADVTDQNEIKKIIDRIHTDIGSISGFIHGVGIIEDTLLSAKTLDSFKRVLYTKAHSIFYLFELLKNEPMEFVALFSSLATYKGNFGQSDYVAANEVLNSFAQVWNNEVSYPVKSMLWSVWDETGLAGAGLRSEMQKRSIKGISSSRGSACFHNELLHGNKNEPVVIFTTDSSFNYIDQYTIDLIPF